MAHDQLNAKALAGTFFIFYFDKRFICLRSFMLEESLAYFLYLCKFCHLLILFKVTAKLFPIFTFKNANASICWKLFSIRMLLLSFKSFKVFFQLERLN